MVAADGEEVGTVDEVLGDIDADIFNGLRPSSPACSAKPTYVPAEHVAAHRTERFS